jgi:CubicO group peptidase (beta-lactamase class C family)
MKTDHMDLQYQFGVLRVTIKIVITLTIIGLASPWILGASSRLTNTEQTRICIERNRWYLNGDLTYPSTQAEGLLMNVRMVNAVFEDKARSGFDADENTNEFIKKITVYLSHGVRAFTISLQGGFPGYEGAINSAFNPDGSLRKNYLQRVKRVIEACDRNGAAVILGCYYQRQDQILKDEKAVRKGVVNTVRWLAKSGYTNVVLEIANEFNHSGFDHPILKKSEGQVELIQLAKETWPKLQVSTSGLGNGRLPDNVCRASDFLLIHFNGTKLEDIPKRIQALKKYGKPIICNEDQKYGEQAAEAARLSVENGASWGFMHEKINQHFPFHFNGADDDLKVYHMLKKLTTEVGAETYFPPPESNGGWRKLTDSEQIRTITGMDFEKLDKLERWLFETGSDKHDFALVVIRHGYIVLEIEKGLGTNEFPDRVGVASCAKAICAAVLAIASEKSQQGFTPKKMTFNDPAFQYIPWAEPLSDPRKAKITVKQLLNHTSGLVGEWWQNKERFVKNHGPWEWVLGHSGDWKTEKLLFEPGTDLEYTTHGLYHAALLCEGVTGLPYDRFTIEQLFKHLGIEKWWFEYFTGDQKHGKHPSHSLALSARDMARIAYCMLRNGKWRGEQIIPEWFIDETAAPTHNIKGTKTFSREAQSFSHGWELPARLTDGRGEGIPIDARFKPGAGGQLIAFVPSLDLVLARKKGGGWPEFEYEKFLRLTCEAVFD